MRTYRSVTPRPYWLKGDKPALGQLLMIADNTGFSTGIHTHMGLYRVDLNPTTGGIVKLDTNAAEGSYDPSLFFTNEYVADVASYATLLASNLRYYRYRWLRVVVPCERSAAESEHKKKAVHDSDCVIHFETVP